MNIKNVLNRLAVVPLAYVTVLGACGREPAAYEPTDVASISAPPVATTENFIPGANGFALQPIDADATARVQTESVNIRLGKLIPRLDPDSLGHFPTLTGDVYVDVVALDIVDAGTPTVDAGTSTVDAGTPTVDAGTPPEEVDAGTACDEGGVLCGGTCVNPLDDANNCGGCGIVCGAAEACHSGLCTAGCSN